MGLWMSALNSTWADDARLCDYECLADSIGAAPRCQHVSMHPQAMQLDGACILVATAL